MYSFRGIYLLEDRNDRNLGSLLKRQTKTKLNGQDKKAEKPPTILDRTYRWISRGPGSVLIERDYVLIQVPIDAKSALAVPEKFCSDVRTPRGMSCLMSSHHRI